LRLDLHTLNPRQRDAVMHDDGPLLVLAGAGSGKTRVIIYRIARLIGDGTSPSRILGVTFTNKAAGEMRERLRSLVGADGSKVQLSTFHALGLSILKAEHEAAGLAKRFCIYDTADQMSLVRELMRRVRVADRRLDAGKILDIILKTKRERREEVEIDWGDDYELAAYELYPRYVAEMRAFNAVDFDDLLLRSMDVLLIPEVGERWSKKFDYILVDEYQDTSSDQLAMLKILAGERNNVCVVGDDDQSIYAWRGAVVDNILRFGREFGSAKEVILDQNYRSTGHILNAANSVIQNNKVRKDKKLWSADGEGEPIHVVTCEDGEEEATLVSETIGKLVFEGMRYEDIAVLYRSNLQSRLLEEILAADKIPYRIVGGQAFFERKEVRDVMAYLATINNPFDEISLRRVVNMPSRGIGPTSLQRFAAFGEQNDCGLYGALCRASEVPDIPKAAQAGAQQFVGLIRNFGAQMQDAQPHQLQGHVESLIEEIKLRDVIIAADDSATVSERRIENVNEVINAAHRFAAMNPHSTSPLEDFIFMSSLVKNDEKDDDQGKVTLMTLHSAKGLEYPAVFMVGMEEELLPHRRTIELGGDLSEERRLCYVGITRAKQRLWLTKCLYRSSRGKMMERGSSRFLEELPEGDGVLRWNRNSPPTDEMTESKAEDFLAKIRAQLEMDEV
jgi:superfamily I DNA/RNA helicase